MLICAEGVCVLASGIDVENVVDPKEWMREYRQKRLEKNKESELCKIE